MAQQERIPRMDFGLAVDIMKSAYSQLRKFGYAGENIEKATPDLLRSLENSPNFQSQTLEDGSVHRLADARDALHGTRGWSLYTRSCQDPNFDEYALVFILEPPDEEGGGSNVRFSIARRIQIIRKAGKKAGWPETSLAYDREAVGALARAALAKTPISVSTPVGGDPFEAVKAARPATDERGDYEWLLRWSGVETESSSDTKKASTSSFDDPLRGGDTTVVRTTPKKEVFDPLAGSSVASGPSLDGGRVAGATTPSEMSVILDRVAKKEITAEQAGILIAALKS